MEGENSRNLIREGNVSLILNSYGDLFSDFDPRIYGERALSDDFLLECRRAARDKEGGFELRLLVPKKLRDKKSEFEIRRRLKNHFQKHFHEEESEIRGIKRHGFMWFVLGSLVMVGATFLHGTSSFWSKFIFIMAEPAGWFFFWEGLDKVFIASKEKKADYIFYKKMSMAKIDFLDY